MEVDRTGHGLGDGGEEIGGLGSERRETLERNGTLQRIDPERTVDMVSLEGEEGEVLVAKFGVLFRSAFLSGKVLERELANNISGS